MRFSDDPVNEFQRLYPMLDKDQLEHAEENFTRYLALVLRIYERVHIDPEARQRLRSLTSDHRDGTMAPERSARPS